MGRIIGKVAAAAAGMTLVSVLIAGSFIGALHRPSPHGVPVGVVAPAGQVAQLGAAFGRAAPGAFALTRYPSPGAARQAVLDRGIDAALVMGPGREQLLVASAAGRFAAQAVTGAFQAEAAAAGQRLVVTDIRPLPPGDESGISPLFVFIATVLPSAAFGVVLAGLIGRKLGLAWRLAALAGFAVLAGLAVAWTADGLAGALAGAPWGLAGIGMLTAFSVSAACAAAWRLAGPPLAALVFLLIFPVGVPAAGGPIGPRFVTSWYADLGSGLPAGAELPAIRDIVYFDGHGLGTPLLVLSLWAGISALALALPPLPVPKRRAGQASRRDEPAATV